MHDLDMKRIRKVLIIAFVTVAILVFCWYENHHLVTTFYKYQDSRVPESFDGYRIVQISDFHNARFGADNRKILDKISELHPDIIVVTGDLVDSNHTNIDVSLAFIDEAVKIAEVYYVTGNHEYWLTEAELEKLIHGLCKAGVHVMANATEEVSIQDDSAVIIGLDDNYLSGTKLKEIIQENANDKLSIVLAHEPQYFNRYQEAGADVVFTGHAHGGQFRLPFLGGIYAPNQGFLPTLTEGCHTENGTTMYVSRGLGNSAFPVRLLNDPEIVCVDLVCE